MITLEGIISSIIHYAQSNPPLAVGALVALLAVTYLKPKPMFGLYAFLAFMAVVIYALSLFGAPMEAGTKYKMSMGNKTIKAIDE